MVKKFLALIVMIVVMFSFSGCINIPDKELKGLGSFEGLDPEIELQIIKTYFGDEYKGQESIDECIIGVYYGTYNGSVVVYCYGWAWGGWQFGLFTVEKIEGYLFVYPRTGIRVWNEGVFYSLQDAFDKGFLVKEDLEQIETLMREYHSGFYIDPPDVPTDSWNQYQ